MELVGFLLQLTSDRGCRMPATLLEKPKVEMRAANCAWCSCAVNVPRDFDGEVYCRRCFQAMKKNDNAVLSKRYKPLGDVEHEMSKVR